MAAPAAEPEVPCSTIRFPNGSIAVVPHPTIEGHWSRRLAGAIVAAAVDLRLEELRRG